MAAFSKPHGLIEAGKDDGMIQYIHDMWNYIHLIGYFPLVHRFLVAMGHYGTWLSSIKSILPRFVTTRSSNGPETTNNPFAVGQ